MAKDLMFTLGADTASFQANMKKAADSCKGIQDAISVIKLDALVNLGRQAMSTASQITTFAESGARVKSIAEAFQTMSANSGIAADQLITKLKEVTGETVASSDLMLKANRMIVEGFSASQIAQMGEAARVAAHLMGTDVSTAYEHLTDAVVNLRQRGLRTAGFVIDLNAAYQAHADKLGIASTSLNQYGKQMALEEAVYSKAMEMQAQMGKGLDDEFERVQKAKAGWKDLWETVAGGASSAYSAVANFFGQGFAELKKVQEGRRIGTMGGEGPGYGGGGPPTAQTAKDQQTMMDAEKIIADTLNLKKQMLEVGYQTIDSRIKELEIDRQLAVIALQRYGNTGGLIAQTNQLFASKKAEAIFEDTISQHLKYDTVMAGDMTYNYKQIAEAESHMVSEQDAILANTKASTSEKIKELEVLIKQLKIEQDRATIIERTAGQVAISGLGVQEARGGLRPGQVALQTAAIQQADITSEIARKEQEVELINEKIDELKKDVLLNDAQITTENDKVEKIINDIVGLQGQWKVLEADKLKQIAEYAPAYQGIIDGFNKYITDMGTGYTQLENATKGVTSGIESAFTGVFSNIFDKSQTFAQRMQKMFQDMVQAIITELAKVVAKQAVSGLGSGMNIIGNLLGIGGGGAAEGSWESMHLGGVAASAFGEMSFYQHGTPYVPQTGPAILHKGEAVIPANKNKGGGDVNTTNVFIQATDVGSFARLYGPTIESIYFGGRRFNKVAMRNQ